jgi:hypothetical protein
MIASRSIPLRLPAASLDPARFTAATLIDLSSLSRPVDATHSVVDFIMQSVAPAGSRGAYDPPAGVLEIAARAIDFRLGDPLADLRCPTLNAIARELNDLRVHSTNHLLKCTQLL